jgi:hypothetical protein
MKQKIAALGVLISVRVAVCQKRQILLLLGKLPDITRGILERDLAAAVRQHDRVIEFALTALVSHRVRRGR